MRIISKFKDYYDYLSGVYGIDNKVVYIRDSKDVDKTKDFSSFDYRFEVKKDGKEYYIYLEHIWFCDEDFPFITIREGFNDYTEWISYSFEEIEDWLNFLEVKNFVRNEIEKHFQTKSNKKVNTELKSPQIYQIKEKYTTDILLKDYGFQRILDAMQAYQRVAMFIAAPPDVPQTVPTDIIRFEGKGFDKKTSFRKM